VNNVLWEVLGTAFMADLSDKRYMRAKDYVNFFKSLPPVGTSPYSKQIIWRRVEDIREVLPGDIIAYRWGKEKFTHTQIFATLSTVLVNIYTTKLKEMRSSAVYRGGADFIRHLSEDGETAPEYDVLGWARNAKAILKDKFGVTCMRGCGANSLCYKDVSSGMLTGAPNRNFAEISQAIDPRYNLVDHLKEVCESEGARHTGHIVIARGRVREVRNLQGGRNADPFIWRVPIVHSTGSREGVAMDGEYKRFEVRSDGKPYYSNGEEAFIGRIVV